MAIFLSQETAEWLLLGGSPLYTNAAVWVGIAIQPLVAIILLAVARVGVSLARNLEPQATPRAIPKDAPERMCISFADRCVTMFDRLGPQRRGPPVVA